MDSERTQKNNGVIPFSATRTRSLAVVLIVVATVAFGQGKLDATLASGAYERRLSELRDMTPRSYFETGFIAALLAGEKFIQDLDRFGAGKTVAALSFTGKPFPLGKRGIPETITYEKLRLSMATLRESLGKAAVSLELGGSGPWKETIKPGLALLDFNRDGKRSANESAGAAALWLGRQFGLGPEQAGNAVVTLDAADSLWLSGYCRLVGACLDLALAYDFKPLYSVYCRLVFPLPSDLPKPSSDVPVSREPFVFPVVKPENGERARKEILKAIELSRRTLNSAASEKDDDDEWIPGPTQTSVSGLAIPSVLAVKWIAFLGEWEDALEGRKLLAFSDGKKGIDLKAIISSLPQLSIDLEKSLEPFARPAEAKKLVGSSPDFRWFLTDGRIYTLFLN